MTALIAFFAIGLAVAGVFGGVLLPEHTLGGMDFLNFFYPQAVLVQHAFAAGELPLWNWYQWGGAPSLASMQGAPLYPPMWLTLALGLLPYALQLSIYAHLVWGGVGAVLLTRCAWRTGRLSSLYAGAAYACGGFMLGHIEQPSVLAAIVWAPWIIGLGLRYALGQARVGWFILALALALLAGHPQSAVLPVVFLEVLLASWFIFQRLSRRPDERAAARQTGLRLLKLQPAIALGALLAAAQLLPTHELSGLSERVWPYPDPNEPALQWRFLPAMLIPRFFNRLAETPGQPIAYTELGLYCGMATVALFLLGLWRLARRESTPLGWAILLTWALSLLYALGRQGLVTPVFFRLVPFLAHSRAAARSLNVETLLFGSIAAFGLQQIVLHIAASGQPADSPEAPAARKRRVASRGFALAALVLVSADLAVTHSGELTTLFVSTEILNAPLPTQALLPQIASRSPRLYRFMANDSDFYLDHRSSAVFQRRVRLQPNLNTLHGLPTTDGYEEGLLPTRSYANFLRRFNRNLRSGTPDAALLALMGSNTMFTEYPLENSGSLWSPLAPPLRVGDSTYWFWQSSCPGTLFLDAQTMNRAVATTQETETPAPKPSFGQPGTLRSEQSAQAFLREGYWYEPAGREVQPHAYARLTSQTLARAAEQARLKIVERRTNRLIIESDSPEARQILFLQSWYPGWKIRSEASGKAPARALTPHSPIFWEFSWPPAASSAPGGGTKATISYEPFSFRLGLFISLFTLAAMAAYGGRLRRRRGE